MRSTLRPILSYAHDLRVRAVWLIVLTSFAVIGGVSWLTYRVNLNSAFAQIDRQASDQLHLIGSTFEVAVGRYRYLPTVLAQARQIGSLFEGPGNPATVDAANRYLENLNRTAGSAALFGLDLNGVARASSNWNSPTSFVGLNYQTRPYFRDALARGAGRFYAVGRTTGEPGYFLSVPILIAEREVGVAVVKIDLRPLARDWTTASEPVAIADEAGILILSAVPEWQYRPVDEIDSARINRLTVDHDYPAARLASGALLDRTGPEASGTLITLRQPAPDTGSLSGSRERILFSRALEPHGWTLLYFAPLDEARRSARTSAMIAALSGLLLMALGLLWRQRLRNLVQERDAKQQLEVLVRQRTAELTAANTHLAAEIAEHRQAEVELRRARDDLIQADKLAAIGQALAGLAHEINQPLAALRTYLASTGQFLRTGNAQVAQGNLSIMRDVIDHLAGLTGRLKTLARRGGDGRRPIQFAASVGRVLELLRYRINDLGIELSAELDQEVQVLGDEARLDQVVLNLINNAIEAVEVGTDKRTLVRLASDGTEAILTVEDSGPGVLPEHANRLFEPFFTTKQVGQGLGLGLATVHRIVTDHGGSVACGRAALGGAVFTVRLPLAVA